MDLNGGCRPIYALKAQKAGTCLIKLLFREKALRNFGYNISFIV